MSNAFVITVVVVLVALLALLVLLLRAAGRPRDLVAPAEFVPGDRSDGALPDGAGPPQARILALIRQRKKIDAIAAIRRETGLPLGQAKRVVDHIAAGGSPPPWFGAMGRTGATATTEVQVDEELRTQLTDLVRRGRTIEAIKVLRNRTGWKLAEAKRYVDGL